MLIVGGVLSSTSTVGSGAWCAWASAVDPALDRLDELLADRLAEGPQRELELDLVGDDVVLGPAVDRADGHDRRLARLDLAADDRLEVDDDQGGQDDRVDRAVRPGAVAALAANRDRRPRSSWRASGPEQ